MIFVRNSLEFGEYRASVSAGIAKNFPVAGGSYHLGESSGLVSIGPQKDISNYGLISEMRFPQGRVVSVYGVVPHLELPEGQMKVQDGAAVHQYTFHRDDLLLEGSSVLQDRVHTTQVFLFRKADDDNQIDVRNPFLQMSIDLTKPPFWIQNRTKVSGVQHHFQACDESVVQRVTFDSGTEMRMEATVGAVPFVHMRHSDGNTLDDIVVRNDELGLHAERLVVGNLNRQGGYLSFTRWSDAGYARVDGGFDNRMAMERYGDTRSYLRFLLDQDLMRPHMSGVVKRTSVTPGDMSSERALQVGVWAPKITLSQTRSFWPATLPQSDVTLVTGTRAEVTTRSKIPGWELLSSNARSQATVEFGAGTFFPEVDMRVGVDEKGIIIGSSLPLQGGRLAHGTTDLSLTCSQSEARKIAVSEVVTDRLGVRRMTYGAQGIQLEFGGSKIAMPVKGEFVRVERD